MHFQPILKQRGSQSRRSSGLELGFALVKSLVELHHGTVSYESRGLGMGSTFTVRLPRLPVETRRTQPEDATGNNQQAARSLRVMVVDDNVDAATMLPEALGNEVPAEHGSRIALKAGQE